MKSLKKLKTAKLFTLFAAALLLIFVINGCTDRKSNSSYRMVSMEQAVEIMEAESGYIILDVRTSEEFKEKRIPGAVNLPNESIGSDEIEELPDKEQLILVYCRSGRRSKLAAEKLVRLGYTNVVEFGGINDWNGETEKG